MAPKSANMDVYSRAAFLAAQVDSLLSNKSHPASLPNPHASGVAPKNSKKRNRAASPRAVAVNDAKKLLRAATAVNSKSLAVPSPRRSLPAVAGFSEGGPQFIHRPPDVARHRRKCAVCHHPEREAIEELFIHWHSPNSIATHFEEESDITWVSIYRHAYAFGLDEIRRRNLRFAFELILEQAGDITATPAAIAASARALGSCVDSNGLWNEPPRRVIVTNIIRNDVSASTSSVGNDTSYRAVHPRDVVTSEAAFASAAPTPQIENHAIPANDGAVVAAGRAYRPASSAMNDSSSDGAVDSVGPDGIYRAEGVHRTPPAPASAQTSSATAPMVPVCSDKVERPSSFRTLHPPACPERDRRVLSEVEGRDVVMSSVSSSAQADREPPASSEETASDKKNFSFRATHPREVPGSDSLPASPEIRNSPNSFKSKETPISNR
ncbi:MAG TPA: hypothetical protein VGR81_14395 [Candidatus Acidoferrales bacterium]|nr:hypothetical protein [Candidatus Acidoferrales bacterium]